jgi:hypothetical protein
MSEMDSEIDYASMIDEAMRGVVYKALKTVEEAGLPGQHHFFISFDTNYPGVEIAEYLHSKYPEEMTIVLQHQYSNLKVTPEYFQVTLSFNNIPQKLQIPFGAMTAFADPSIKFGLQFHLSDSDEEAMLEAMLFDEEDGEQPTPPSGSGKGKGKSSKAKADDNKSADVISLDSFRKK